MRGNLCAACENETMLHWSRDHEKHYNQMQNVQVFGRVSAAAASSSIDWSAGRGGGGIVDEMPESLEDAKFC